MQGFEAGGFRPRRLGDADPHRRIGVIGESIDGVAAVIRRHETVETVKKELADRHPVGHPYEQVLAMIVLESVGAAHAGHQTDRSLPRGMSPASPSIPLTRDR